MLFPLVRAVLRCLARLRRRQRQKQFPFCVPRAPKCGTKVKTRDCVRADTSPRRRRTRPWYVWRLLREQSSQVLVLDLRHGVRAGEDCVEHFVFAQADIFEQIGLHEQHGLHTDHFEYG
jgi:hypothetical protein